MAACRLALSSFQGCWPSKAACRWPNHLSYLSHPAPHCTEPPKLRDRHTLACPWCCCQWFEQPHIYTRKQKTRNRGGGGGIKSLADGGGGMLQLSETTGLLASYALSDRSCFIATYCWDRIFCSSLAPMGGSAYGRTMAPSPGQLCPRRMRKLSRAAIFAESG